jgi:acyl-CoA synthetase (AMP-forming)/AMP-acid ligase II
MEECAAANPYQRAVVFPESRDKSGNVSWTHLTFAQLNRLTDEYARGFVQAGMKPGDRVSLLVKPCLEFIPLVFAVFKVGALPVLSIQAWA